MAKKNESTPDEDTDHGAEAETERGDSPRMVGGYATRDGAGVVVVMPGAEIRLSTNAPPLTDEQIAHAGRLLQALRS